MFIVFDLLVDDKGNSLRAAPASGASQTSGIFRFLCVSEQKRACRQRSGGRLPGGAIAYIPAERRALEVLGRVDLVGRLGRRCGDQIVSGGMRVVHCGGQCRAGRQCSGGGD